MKFFLPTVIAVVVALLGSDVNAQKYRIGTSSLQYSERSEFLGVNVRISHTEKGGVLPSNGNRLDKLLFIWKQGTPLELVAIIDDISLRERNFNWCFAGSDSLCYLRRTGDDIIEQEESTLVYRRISTGEVNRLTDAGRARTVIGDDHGHVVVHSLSRGGGAALETPVFDDAFGWAAAFDLKHNKRIDFPIDHVFAKTASGCWIGDTPQFVYAGDDGAVHLLCLFGETPSHRVLVRPEDLTKERIRHEGPRFWGNFSPYIPVYVCGSRSDGTGFYFLNRFNGMIEKFDLRTEKRSIICRGKVDPDEPRSYGCRVVDSAGVLYTLAEEASWEPLERIVSRQEKRIVTDKNFKYISADNEGGVYGTIAKGGVVHVSKTGELKTVVSLEMIEQAYRNRFEPAASRKDDR